MARFDVGALVAQVLADRPLPSSVGDLDAASRRALETAASRQGVTPDALLSVLRAQRTKDTEAQAASDDAAAIARRIRSRGY